MPRTSGIEMSNMEAMIAKSLEVMTSMLYAMRILEMVEV
jgi:hypothetical protein